VAGMRSDLDTGKKVAEPLNSRASRPHMICCKGMARVSKEGMDGIAPQRGCQPNQRQGADPTPLPVLLGRGIG